MHFPDEDYDNAMRLQNYFSTVFITCLLFACAKPVDDRQQQAMEQLASRSVTCHAGIDCETKWNRAIEWVTKHSERGIRTVNENLIQTYSVAVEHTKPVLRYPEFSVVRYKKSGNTYVFDFKCYCDNGFKCDPSGLKLRASFNTFIMGVPPGVKVQGGY